MSSLVTLGDLRHNSNYEKMYIDPLICDVLNTTVEEIASSCAQIQYLLDNITLVLSGKSPYVVSVADGGLITSASINDASEIGDRVVATGGTTVCTIAVISWRSCISLMNFINNLKH